MGLRAVYQSGAKHIPRGLSAASKRILRTACTRRQTSVPGRSQLVRQQQRRQTAGLVRRLRSLCARKLRRRRTAARRPWWRTRWFAQRAAHAVSFFVHSTAHGELQVIHRLGRCIVCNRAARRFGSPRIAAALCRPYVASNSGYMHTCSHAPPVLVPSGQLCRACILIQRVPRVRHTSNVMRVD